MLHRQWPVLLMLCVGPLGAQTVKLPAEVKGEVGAFVRVQSETAEKEVRWYSPDAGLAVFPVELLKDSKTAVVTATKAGRYRMVAWTAKGDVPSLPAECLVIIVDSPVPPGPGPGPGPDPPSPTDPLVIALQSAWANVPAGERPFKDVLQALYSQSAEMLLAKRPDDPSQYVSTFATWGELLQQLKDASATLKLSDKLVPIRTVIAGELKTVFPTEGSTAFTVADRAKAAEQFRKVAGAIGRVK